MQAAAGEGWCVNTEIGRIGGNVGAIAVDNVKLIGGPWLEYRAGVALGCEVAEKITERK